MSPNIPQSVRDEEEQMFEEYLTTECKENPDVVRNRMQYVREYCLLQPESDGFDGYVSDAPIRHCRFRNLILEHTNMSDKSFKMFESLHDATDKLGLCYEATCEFILYIWFHLNSWKWRERISYNEQLQSFIEDVKTKSCNKISIRITAENANGNVSRLEWDDDVFVSYLILILSESRLNLLNMTSLNDMELRKPYYYLISTLLNHLPFKYKRPKRGKYNQAERNLCLCALWLTGYIKRERGEESINFRPDYPDKKNGIFDNIMRYYSQEKVPYIGSRF